MSLIFQASEYFLVQKSVFQFLLRVILFSQVLLRSQFSEILMAPLQIL